MSRFLSKDFLSGLLFVAFAVAVLWFGRYLPVGTTVRMGPGYVPHALAYLMLILGFAITVTAMIHPGDVVDAPKWKPLTLVTLGIICFALLFERAGLLPALVVLIFIASWAGDNFRFREVMANVVVLAVLCVVVFKLGLDMNISIIAGVW